MEKENHKSTKHKLAAKELDLKETKDELDKFKLESAAKRRKLLDLKQSSDQFLTSLDY